MKMKYIVSREWTVQCLGLDENRKQNLMKTEHEDLDSSSYITVQATNSEGLFDKICTVFRGGLVFIEYLLAP